MRTLYVVECTPRNGGRYVCDFTGHEYSSKNFREAHRMKREISQYLRNRSKKWRKSDFRVVKYGAL